MTPSGIVTLLTDFGTRDPFVGVMKGVILSREAQLRVVDLTHEVERHAVADAAFWLAQAFGWFPAGTVHLAVVDPGVGGARAAVAMQADEHLFVGPDNGVFEVVARRAKSVEVRQLFPERLRLPTPSRTFHGRDVFAPVAAMLASGTRAFADIGPSALLSPTALVPEPELTGEGARGAVVVVDHFGNLITNVPAAAVAAGRTQRIRLGGRDLALVGAYSDVPLGEPAAVLGSFGTVEVFVREGSAAAALGVKRGAAVSVGP
jgi:S-adenosylmethionine hydrolase